MSDFRNAVIDFRSLMGERGFWESRDRQKAAIKALGSLYLSGADDADAVTLEATLAEYHRRKEWME